MTITILLRAKAEVRNAAEWYELRKPGLGDEYVDAVEEGLQWIASSPLANSKYEMLPEETTIRRYRLPRFPY